MYADDGDEEQRRRRAMGQIDPSATPAPSNGVAPTSTAGGYAPGGGMEAAPGAKHGTGYVNLQTYLGANRAAGQQMAQGVAANTAQQGDAARAALAGLASGQMVPGDVASKAQDAAARARLAGPQGGGLGAVLASDYGRGGSPYTSGMQGFDAFLTSAAGGQTLAQSANQYAGLGGEVDAANKAALSYVPPPAAAPPPTGPAGMPAAYGAGQPRAPAPAPYSPLTYSPENVEPGGPRRARGQQIDPGRVPYWKRPMGGH